MVAHLTASSIPTGTNYPIKPATNYPIKLVTNYPIKPAANKRPLSGLTQDMLPYAQESKMRFFNTKQKVYLYNS